MASPKQKDRTIHRVDVTAHKRESMPEHLRPMLAVAGELPHQGKLWAFEVKWDGVRALTYWRAAHLRIESRSGNDISPRYPELGAIGDQLGAREAVLDGEIVTFDEHGLPSFELLQARMHQTSASVIARLARDQPVVYVIFDVLYLDGRLTIDLSYKERRALLEELELKGPAWNTPAYQRTGGADFLAVTAQHGLEGLVAKRLDSRYLPGERSGDWLKVKNVNRQELVIGGWLPGKGARAAYIGALLMGYYEGEGKQRQLRYAGRVGTGFNESELAHLTTELAARARRSSPFAKAGVQPPQGARFVQPELVAEIEFSHFTRQRILRHSSYKALRQDKPAAEVEIEVLHETKRYTEIKVQGRTLRLSNRNKVLYPATGFTKGEMVDFYAAIAPVLVPHLAERPLTFKRYPDGVQAEYFYEKRCPSHRPEWVQTAPIYSERLAEPIDYCLLADLPTLIWVANLATIELHTSLSQAWTMQTPTALVFDLDPGPGAALRECCRVALWLRELLAAFKLTTVVKTSGAKGLQVYLPLNTPIGYEQTKPFARAVAELLEKEHRQLVLSRMTKRLRAGKVFIDWSQNDPHKTTVSVYSLRARERPTVSTPLTWEEVERGARARKEQELSAEPPALLERIERYGDLFAPLLSLTQELPQL